MDEQNKLIGAFITITVAIICVASIMVPVLTDVAKTESTLVNDGVYYIANDSESHTLAFDGSDVTVDGEVVDIPSENNYTIFASDTLILRAPVDVDDELQFRGDITATVTSLSLTIANGTVSGTYNGTEAVSASYTDYVLATSSEESLIMKDYTGTASLLADSDIIGRGVTSVYTAADKSSSAYIYIQIDGNVEDGVTVTVPTGYTVSDVSVNAVANNYYVDLYTFTSITFTVTHTNSGAETDCTYSAVIIPEKVTAELTNHLDTAAGGLVLVIPVLMIVAVLMIAVALVAVKRDE